MTCKEVFESLSGYLDDELIPDEADEIETHVERCAPCLAFLNTLQRTVAFCRDATVIPLSDAAHADDRASMKRRFIEAAKALPRD
ncbi:MAG: zf-HC2 domain-containing protein [Acidobacteria bacterium]|nr:zf-HC2 domain-containing protein [Acidobacteriota bacterium]